MGMFDWLKGRAAPTSETTAEPAPQQAPEKADEPANGSAAVAEAAPAPAAGTTPAGDRSRFLEVGWLVDGNSPKFIWESPRSLSGRALPAEHPKGVNRCPAVIDSEVRTFEVLAPVDIHLRIGRNDKGEPSLVNVDAKKASISARKMQSMVTLMSQDRWRDPRRPVIQFSAPYRFVADEPCWLNQLPPYYHYASPPWPGVLIGGRFPIHNWPRSLMWAFEWWDVARDLVIRRGDPWFYARFETLDPERPLRLVEAEMTPELREFCRGLDGITNYINRTFQAMDTAAERRPAKLLKRRERGAPAGPVTASNITEEPHGGDPDERS